VNCWSRFLFAANQPRQRCRLRRPPRSVDKAHIHREEYRIELARSRVARRSADEHFLGECAEVVTTRVSFLPLEDAEIDWYVASGEPEGKAGAYAIQGRAARFIDRIEGSWSNVVGLPLATVSRLLKRVSVAD